MRWADGMLFHRDKAGALPNSQSPVVADGRSMTNTIMPQRTTDSLVNIAQSRKFCDLVSKMIADRWELGRDAGKIRDPARSQLLLARHKGKKP
jgi:hypothetical protein